MRLKISPQVVDGGSSGRSSVRRPGSEDPYRRERKFLLSLSQSLDDLLVSEPVMQKNHCNTAKDFYQYRVCIKKIIICFLSILAQHPRLIDNTDFLIVKIFANLRFLDDFFFNVTS